MSNIEKIRRHVFNQVRKFEYHRNRSYLFTVADLKNGVIDNKLDNDDWHCCSSVYCFLDADENIQYIGKSKEHVCNRLRDHIKKQDDPLINKVKDDWKILIIYTKLWVYTHEYAETDLIQRFQPLLNTIGK